MNPSDPLQINTTPPPLDEKSSRTKKIVLISAGVVTLLLLGVGAWALFFKILPSDSDTGQTAKQTPVPQVKVAKTPTLQTKVLLEGRSNIWDIGFLPNNEILFTERKGTLNLLTNGQVRQIAAIPDVRAVGEGGLMGLAIDPQFAGNRHIYTCFNTSTDIRVVRWVLDSNLTALSNRVDIIVGIPSNPSGRHSGCRLAFGPEGYLWIGTGDTAQNLTPQTPQNPRSLGGKILRVNRNGERVAGNIGGNFDPRIYSYGHRNVQGIAFFPNAINDVVGVSAEHGSTVDDEVNPLKSGNFGWAPPDGAYNETNVAMTDKQKFPDAIDPLWKSGSPTQAPSGVAILNGERWGAWNGAVVMAILKDKHLKILQLDDKLTVVEEDRQLEGQFGRIRAVVQGPDGLLYLTTDNGNGQDKIVQVTPEIL